MNNDTTCFIPIQNETFVAIIDTCDSDLLSLKWGAHKNRPNSIYIRCNSNIHGIKNAYLHRIIMERILGRELTRRERIKHINQDTLDNRRENLKILNAPQKERLVIQVSGDVPKGFKRCTSCKDVLPKTSEYFYPRKGGYFSGMCKECSRDQFRFKYSTNPDKRARMLAYFHKRHAELYIPNPKKLKTEAEKRETKRRAEERRRAIQAGLPATFTDDDWQKALDYFNGCCAVCSRPPGLWHFLAQEHWIAQSKGGGYTSDNILPMCHGIGGCNNSKWNRDPYEWLENKFGARRAKAIASRIHRYFEWVKEQSDST